MIKLDEQYWSTRYVEESTGWDTGEITQPLKAYFDQLSDKDLKILIPGAGNAYEAAYLWKLGFRNVYVLDWSDQPLKKFKQDYPDFPEEQLVQSDFFQYSGQFDLIIEQTFFCAIAPILRKQYVQHVFELLNPGGKLVGLLWDCEFGSDSPPYGGDRQEYESLFADKFDLKVLGKSYNSIKPRLGRELFAIFIKG